MIQIEFCTHVVAGETGLIYFVFVRVTHQLRERRQSELLKLANPLVELAYSETNNISLPAFATVQNRGQLKTRYNFWEIMDKNVRTNGYFVPLKLFKYSSQSFYSKATAGVDGAAQRRAIFRSFTSQFKWEQKLVSQVIKTIAVSAFVAWRMFERQDLL